MHLAFMKISSSCSPNSSSVSASIASSSTHVDATAGNVIGGFACLGIIAVAVFFFIRRRSWETESDGVDPYPSQSSVIALDSLLNSQCKSKISTRYRGSSNTIAFDIRSAGSAEAWSFPSSPSDAIGLQVDALAPSRTEVQRRLQELQG
jgi:hypothetical protein